MGVIFRWFKNFEVEKIEHPMWAGSYYDCSFKCVGDWDCTSHSYGNRSILQDLFEQIGGKIPTLPDSISDDEPEKYIQSLLIEPSEMSKKCQELLDSDLYLEDMEDRIGWIKELSDKGYYVAYDML